MNTLKRENEHLVLDNLGLVRHIAKSIDTSNFNFDFEDKVSIGTIGLIKAVITFDEDRNIKFATYAGKCILNEILMYTRKEKMEVGILHFEDAISIQEDGAALKVGDLIYDKRNYYDECNAKLTTEKFFNWVLNLNDAKKRNVILLRYAGINQNEIADTLGYCQSYISRLEKKLKKEVKQELNKKDMGDRICYFEKIDEVFRFTLYIPYLRKNREVLKTVKEETKRIQLKYFEIEEYSNQKIVIKLLEEDNSVVFMADILNQLT